MFVVGSQAAGFDNSQGPLNGKKYDNRAEDSTTYAQKNERPISHHHDGAEPCRDCLRRSAAPLPIAAV